MAKRRNKILITICLTIFVAGIIWSAFVLFAPNKDLVKIIRDGEVLYTFELSKTADTTIKIPYGDSSNTVEIKDGKIKMSEAECPDRVCVDSGWLSSSAMPIVCLPNHLVIEFADENSEVDAVAG